MIKSLEKELSNEKALARLHSGINRFFFLKHLFSAVQKLNRKLLHRDLKPGNILVIEEGTSGRYLPAIVDFGVSTTELRFKPLDGTSLYMPFEFCGRDKNGQIVEHHEIFRNSYQDMFALAVIRQA